MQWAIWKLYQHGLEDIPETDFDGPGGGLSWRVSQPVHERTILVPVIGPNILMTKLVPGYLFLKVYIF